MQPPSKPFENTEQLRGKISAVLVTKRTADGLRKS
jgi:hypothetical protein